jgi:tetratricopeptide (TPR) repeat protein
MRLATPVRAAVLGAVLVVATLLSASARAGDEKEARRLFERAELSFNVGKFGEALTDYQAAYEAKPLPGFLFNIAQCYRNMGNFERARFFFRRYLALEPRAPNRHRVDELIDEMSKQLEAKPADASPPPAAALTPPPVATPVSPLELKTGDEPLPPTSPVGGAAPALAESAGTSAPLVTATASAPARRPVWKRWWFWTGVGAVVAGGAVAAFLLTRPETVAPGSLQPIDGR